MDHGSDPRSQFRQCRQSSTLVDRLRRLVGLPHLLRLPQLLEPLPQVAHRTRRLQLALKSQSNQLHCVRERGIGTDGPFQDQKLGKLRQRSRLEPRCKWSIDQHREDCTQHSSHRTHPQRHQKQRRWYRPWWWSEHGSSLGSLELRLRHPRKLECHRPLVASS